MSTIRPDRVRRTVAVAVGALLLSVVLSAGFGGGFGAGFGAGFGGSAAFAGDPKVDGSPLTGTALRYIGWNCSAAALGAGETKSAGSEVRIPGVVSVAGTLSKPTVKSWYRGHTPGRFVALVNATRAGQPVELRATVEFRRTPCRLVAWVVLAAP